MKILQGKVYHSVYNEKQFLANEVDSSEAKNEEKPMLPPTVIHVTDFTEWSAMWFRMEMNYAMKANQDVIPVYIDSYGGSVYALMTMIDVIKSCPKKVATIATGKAMSCGSALLAAGSPGLRFATPNSTIMIHEVSNMTWGKNTDMKADIKQTDRLQNVLFNMIDAGANKEPGYVDSMLHGMGRCDWYMNAYEAKAHGFVDHVENPVLLNKTSIDDLLLYALQHKLAPCEPDEETLEKASKASTVLDSFFFDLKKVEDTDSDTVIIEGVAACEEVDRKRAIFDYETSVPNFKSWSDEQFNATGGLSYGNVRSMHNPDIATGRLIEAPVFDNENKAIRVKLEIVDPTEVKKLKAGLYSGLSVGGKIAKMWKDASTGLFRYTAVFNELSLADRPCMPSAKLAL